MDGNESDSNESARLKEQLKELENCVQELICFSNRNDYRFNLISKSRNQIEKENFFRCQKSLKEMIDKIQKSFNFELQVS